MNKTHPSVLEDAQITVRKDSSFYQETFEDSSNQQKSMQDREQIQMPQMSARANSTIIVQNRGVTQVIEAFEDSTNQQRCMQGRELSQMPQVSAQANPTVIIQNTINIGPKITIFGRKPVRTTCDACDEDVLTEIEYECGDYACYKGTKNCFDGLWICCLCCPFCLDDDKDVIHSCPYCQHIIYRWVP